MPWTAKDAKDHKKGLNAKAARAWAAIANSAMKRCEAEGKADCEQHAIMQANAMAGKMMEAEDELYGLLVDELGDLTEDDLGAEEADQSYNDIQQALRNAVSDGLSRDTYAWVQDVWEDRFVYELSGNGQYQCYQRTYEIDANGKVTLGDPVKVRRQTIYVPMVERQMDPNVGGGVDRSKIPAADFAGKNKSYPIVIPGDVSDAASSIGHAGPGNYSSDVLKRRIIAIAKRKGAAFVAELPEKWKEELGLKKAAEAGSHAAEVRESQDPFEGEFMGDMTPLIEKHIGKTGEMPIKIIAPGWGSSGYYTAEVLKRDGPKIYPKGTQMFWDHPTQKEAEDRPERSLHGLAAVMTSDASYKEKGSEGPGLYATARVFSHYAPMVEEMAPHIGLSIYGMGRWQEGEAEGKKGRIIQELTYGRSVDFVTAAGAGGRVLELYESARGLIPPVQAAQKGGKAVDEIEAKALKEANDRMAEQLKEMKEQADKTNQELARMRETNVLREARDVVTARIASTTLPDVTKGRLIRDLSGNPPVTDEGMLDKDAYLSRIDEAVKDEASYLSELNVGSGAIRNMGSVFSTTGGKEPTMEDADKELKDALGSLGIGKAAAEFAVSGR